MQLRINLKILAIVLYAVGFFVTGPFAARDFSSDPISKVVMAGCLSLLWPVYWTFKAWFFLADAMN